MENHKPKNPWLAGLLSLFVWGLGHYYCGHTKKGILLFLAYFPAMFMVGILCFLPPPKLNIALYILFLLSTNILIAWDAIQLTKGLTPSESAQKIISVNSIILLMAVGLITIRLFKSTVIKNHFFEAFKITSASMAPALQNKDFVLIDKWNFKKGEILRGDVIVFLFSDDPEKKFIKRVIGLPGEKLSIMNGTVFINGKELNETYSNHSYPIEEKSSALWNNFGPVDIPKDNVFVLGDNRQNSLDSRQKGFIKSTNILGKAGVIYFSFQDYPFQIRWNKIGEFVN